VNGVFPEKFSQIKIWKLANSVFWLIVGVYRVPRESHWSFPWDVWHHWMCTGRTRLMKISVHNFRAENVAFNFAICDFIAFSQCNETSSIGKWLCKLQYLRRRAHCCIPWCTLVHKRVGVGDRKLYRHVSTCRALIPINLFTFAVGCSFSHNVQRHTYYQWQ